MRRNPEFVALLLLLVVPLPCGSETLFAGIYHGYVRQDRWGQKVLQQGPYALFVSEPVFKELQAKTGQPLAVEITDLLQPMNPGAGRVEGIGSADIQPLEHDISLELRADQTSIRSGEGLVLTVTVRNISDTKLWWPIESLWVVFTRQSGDLNTPGPNGENLWPYRDGFWKWWDPWSEKLSLAAREVPLVWAGAFRSTDPCNPNRIPPGWVVEQEAIVGTELSPGEYEVFVYWKTDNLSYPSGAMSEVLAFDVLEP